MSLLIVLVITAALIYFKVIYIPSTHHRLYEDMKQIAIKLRRQQQELETSKSTVQDKTKQIEMLQKTINHLETELEDIHQSDDQLQQVQNELSEARRQNIELSAKIRTLESTISSLRQQLTETQSANLELVSRLRNEAARSQRMNSIDRLRLQHDDLSALVVPSSSSPTTIAQIGGSPDNIQPIDEMIISRANIDAGPGFGNQGDAEQAGQVPPSEDNQRSLEVRQDRKALILQVDMGDMTAEPSTRIVGREESDEKLVGQSLQEENQQPNTMPREIDLTDIPIDQDDNKGDGKVEKLVKRFEEGEQADEVKHSCEEAKDQEPELTKNEDAETLSDSTQGGINEASNQRTAEEFPLVECPQFDSINHNEHSDKPDEGYTKTSIVENDDTEDHLQGEETDQTVINEQSSCAENEESKESTAAVSDRAEANEILMSKSKETDKNLPTDLTEMATAPEHVVATTEAQATTVEVEETSTITGDNVHSQDDQTEQLNILQSGVKNALDHLSLNPDLSIDEDDDKDRNDMARMYDSNVASSLSAVLVPDAAQGTKDDDTILRVFRHPWNEAIHPNCTLGMKGMGTAVLEAGMQDMSYGVYVQTTPKEM